MIRLTITTLLALALVGAFGTRAALAEEVKCEGTITKIEGEKVTVKTPANQEKQMWVVPATKIMINGKEAKPNELKVGQQVKCTCNKEGNKMTCNMIEVSTRTP
jgi:ribosomal protein S1